MKLMLKKMAILKKNICRPNSLEQLVISGPHYFVGTPFNKEPRENCQNNQDYDDIDLINIENDYLPRVVYNSHRKIFSRGETN